MPSRLTPTKLRSRVARRSGAHPPARSTEFRPAARDTARHRRAGGPEDRALYHCSCGYVFRADVTASVGCPSCGQAQAW